jgi:hypothetical protein
VPRLPRHPVASRPWSSSTCPHARVRMRNESASRPYPLLLAAGSLRGRRSCGHRPNRRDASPNAATARVHRVPPTPCRSTERIGSRGALFFAGRARGRPRMPRLTVECDVATLTPMGTVRCPRHGDDYSGPLACPHVSAAVWSNATIPRATPFAIFTEAVSVPAVACLACAAGSGIAEGTTIDWRDDLPDLAPVCGQCFGNLERR